MHWKNGRLILLSWALVATTLADAAEPTDAERDFFEAKIRPVLVEHCYECHSTDSNKLRGGLRVDSREAIRAGGDSGEAVIPGNPEESLLLSALRHESFEMPPSGKLADSLIDDFATWIKQGAFDPREGTAVAASSTIDWDKARQFWSFRPIEQVAVPETVDDWPRDDVDRFLYAKMKSTDIAPASDADPRVLIRRLYFDLIGLPPTPDQIYDFLADCENDQVAAVESLVDRLLASPQFGERWGRYWLDVARFAESTGGGRSQVLRDAWRYRDYVLNAFNNDKPFNEFVVEQIAGDLLEHESREQEAEHLTATGFLVLGPTNYELQDKELLRMEVIDEQIDTIGRAFLGLTIGCARCHDHKFDPIPTTDYYALVGIFRSTKTLTPGNVSGFVTRSLPLPPEQQSALDRYAAAESQLQKQFDAVKSQLKQSGVTVAAASRSNVAIRDLPGIVVDDASAEIIGSWSASRSVTGFVGAGYIHDASANDGQRHVVFTPEIPATGDYEVRLSYTAATNRAAAAPVTVQYAGGQQLVRVDQRRTPPIDGMFVLLGTYRFEQGTAGSITVGNEGAQGHVIADAVQLLPVREIATNSADASATESTSDAGNAAEADRKRLERQLKSLEQKLAEMKKEAPPPAPQVMSVEDESDAGDYHLCIRGNAHILGDIVPRGVLTVLSDSPQLDLPAGQSGRLELARWIASSENPLTARVYVNRVWRHLFGDGIVRTPDSFGASGERPTHPELLDHLTRDFIEHDWSTKHLVRRLVLTRAYQLSSDDEALAKVDPENRLFARYQRRRLDAEALRDSMLLVSGRLDQSFGGTAIAAKVGSEYNYPFETNRRGVYVPAFRNAQDPLFEVFDFANPNLVVGARNVSTLPTQALFLMNSPFVVEHSRAAAERLLARTDLSDEERIVLTCEQTIGRPPTPREFELAAEFVNSSASGDSTAKNRLEGWSEFCQTLFGCLDFRYLR